jgi:hypothetical protein
MTDHYRIDGTCLDVPDLYVDAIVENVDLDGNVHLSEAVDTDPRTWIVNLDDFNEWQERNRAAEHDNLSDPDHAIWSNLADVYTSRDETPHDDASESLEAYCQDIFTTLVYQHTN